MLWLVVTALAVLTAAYGLAKAFSDFRAKRWLWMLVGLCVAAGPTLALSIMAQVMYDYRHR